MMVIPFKMAEAVKPESAAVLKKRGELALG